VAASKSCAHWRRGAGVQPGHPVPLRNACRVKIEPIRRSAQSAIPAVLTPCPATIGRGAQHDLGRGYRPMARPLPELLELEPDDVHMGKVI
jgi:hypothetical protein